MNDRRTMALLLAGMLAALALISQVACGESAKPVHSQRSSTAQAAADIDTSTPPHAAATSTEIAEIPTAAVVQEDGNALYPPMVSPEPTRDPLEGEPPGTQLVGSCLITPDMVEVFSPEAVARGQRVWDGPGVRFYLRGDGSCVHLFLAPNATPPDYAPDHIDTGTPLAQ